MKIKLVIPLIFAVLCVLGCKNEQRNENRINVEIESISTDNKLNKYTAHYTDVEYKYGKDIYGQSVRIDIEKKDFSNITNSDFVEFVRISSKIYDNIIISFEDHTAIVFSNHYKYGEYGGWDSDSGITKKIGEYNLDENNQYIYKDLLKQEKEI